ncbi:MAG: hypothetical protein ACT4O1_07950 [Gemmatimonadota bacterium]
MNRPGAALVLLMLSASVVHAQIRVDPNGVNVNVQGATTVFLTFGGLNDYVPVEAIWCGRVVPAAPALGKRCDPATIFGQLPIRYDRSKLQNSTFTDIMSIPASVSRRAYEAALSGETSSFFYVRRFVSRTGGADQYVAVTCRLAGGGARVPFGLTHVDMRFDVESPLLLVKAGDKLPAIHAEIAYNGTGRLRGRWEIVLPGEELPSTRDLLTEATLPPNERGLQRRYAEIERFNIFLPPTGRVVLPGPDPARLPNTIDGTYFVLLRIEASDDKENDSRLASVGAGQGVIHSGAVAGFPMPTLRYFVGASASDLSVATAGDLRLLLPLDDATFAADSVPTFSWIAEPSASYYRFELERTGDSKLVFSAIVDAAIPAYQLPPFAAADIPDGNGRWRVVSLDANARELQKSLWRQLRRTQ